MIDNNELKQKALEHGLCDKWAAKWTDDYTVNDLLKMLMSIDGMQFLAEKEFPSIGYIIRNGGEHLTEYGIYAKKLEDVTLPIYGVKIHILGSNCNVYVPDWYVGIVYVSNTSNVKFYIGDECDVRIRCYKPNSNVIIASKGSESKVEVKNEQVKK